MPPWSLHHFVNATAVSYISLLRPCRPVKPLSVTTPRWISVSVTPVAVAPFASPGRQTLGMSPKPPLARAVASLALGADDAPVELVDELLDAEPPLRLHDATTSTSTTATAIARNCFIRLSPRSASDHPPI